MRKKKRFRIKKGSFELPNESFFYNQYCSLQIETLLIKPKLVNI